MNFKQMYAVILSLFVLVGVVPIASYAGPSSPEKLESLKISYLASSMYRDLFIAKEEGFYKANGIDAKLVEIRPAAERMASLTSGRVDVTATYTGSAISAVAAGAKIKLVVAASRPSEGHGDGFLAVRRGSPYNSIEDLEGKIIAVTVRGSSLWLAPIEEFDKRGIKADIRPMDDFTSALLAGAVDASVTFSRELTKFKSKIRPILTIEAWRTHNAACGYFVLTELWESKPALIRNFVQALKQVRQFIKEHPEQAVKHTLKYTKVPEKEWSKEQDMLFDDDPVIHMWALRHVQQLYLKDGLLRQPADLNKMVIVAPFVRILEERPE
jgi:NitT/TauT family transport system substrate-binding protein